MMMKGGTEVKRILVLGKGSYIGDSFKHYLDGIDGDYICDVLDTVSDEWKNSSFVGYDAVYQVAGLAHLKETPELRDKYYYVNCDLAVACAEKAKAEGVPLFVYISTVSVYGMYSGVITRDTPPAPNSYYGESKLKAEGILSSMADDGFKVAVIRPPMVYGKGCKGNFPTLVRFAEKSPLFPTKKNRRSMIYVDNMSEFVRHLIDRGEGGLYFPQNSEYICTAEMVRHIAKYKGKKMWFTGIFNPFISLIRVRTVKKVFGDLYYDFHDDDISVISFEESVRRSVSDD